MQYFDAKPLDQAAFYMTSLLPIMGIGMFFVILNLDDYRVEVEVPWLPFLPLVIAMCFWLYAWMESVKGYVVSTEGIEIKRTLLPSKKITWDYIYQVDIAHPDDFGLTYRKKGNGGVFGYYGLFRSKVRGKMEWYVTNREELVCLHYGRIHEIVISPENSEDFVKLCKGYL